MAAGKQSGEISRHFLKYLIALGKSCRNAAWAPNSSKISGLFVSINLL